MPTYFYDDSRNLWVYSRRRLVLVGWGVEKRNIGFYMAMAYLYDLGLLNKAGISYRYHRVDREQIRAAIGRGWE